MREFREVLSYRGSGEKKMHLCMLPKKYLVMKITYWPLEPSEATPPKIGHFLPALMYVLVLRSQDTQPCKGSLIGMVLADLGAREAGGVCWHSGFPAH